MEAMRQYDTHAMYAASATVALFFDFFALRPFLTIAFMYIFFFLSAFSSTLSVSAYASSRLHHFLAVFGGLSVATRGEAASTSLLSTYRYICTAAERSGTEAVGVKAADSRYEYKAIYRSTAATISAGGGVAAAGSAVVHRLPQGGRKETFW